MGKKVTLKYPCSSSNTKRKMQYQKNQKHQKNGQKRNKSLCLSMHLQLEAHLKWVAIARYFQLYAFVYDVDDKTGASRGREKHLCFYNAFSGFLRGPTHSRMSFHAVHPFSSREALCMLPLPLLPSF